MLMRSIVQISLKFRYLVVFSAIIVMVFGVGQIRRTPVDVFPEFAPPRVEIQTPTLGLSAEEVESLVTIPLEESLNGVDGLDVMRSKSVPQLSSIELIFEPGTDLMEARQLVQERINIVTHRLPTWASPPFMLPPLSATSRTLKIGISSDTVDMREMSMTAYWKIRERLLRVPGVANVAIWGERLQMFQVQVDPERLRANNVSMDDVMETTANSLNVGLLQYSDGAIIGTDGFIDTPNQRLPIHHSLPIVTADDLAGIAIRTEEDGSIIRLVDVANLVEENQPLVGDAVINDGPGLLLIVEKFPWGNTLEVTEGVEAAIEEMSPGLPGLDIDTTIFRPATFIEMSIDNLTESALIGALLVIVILFIFLWDWRIALISATIIPLTVMITLLVLSLIGMTVNVMVLAGLVIALGAVVDDAIVDVENIVRRLRQFREEGSDKSTAEIVLDASVEVRNAIIYASLIEMTALVPVLFLEGLAGSFFKPLATAYVVATLVSPLVALTVTPALILILLDRAPVENRVSPIIPRLHRIYDGILSRVILKPRFAYVTVVVVMLAGGLVYPFLGQELLPNFKERDFLMHWLTRPGTSLPEMQRITTQSSVELRQIDGVRNFGAHIGQALIMDEVVGIYFGENWVSVDPSVDYDETVDNIQATVDGYPGLYRDVQTYLKERIREVLTGASEAIVVRIYGPDLQTLRAKANEVRDEIAGVEGVVDLNVELNVDVPQVEIQVDLEKAARYGIKPGDVRRTAAYWLAGEEVGDIHASNRTWDVQVWSVPEARNSLTSIRNLLIKTPDGGYVRLDDVADVRIVPTPNHIDRESFSRRIDVGANVRGRDLGSVARDVEEILEDIDFPLEYRAEVLGEFEERQAAQQRLIIAGAVAALVILSLLQVSLGNWRMAILSFLSLPMALVGGILAAFFFSSGIISLGSLVGFLTILGVAARNGIMLINHYQHLEEFEGETFGPQLVLRGSRERVAPIMMTAFTAGLALVPLVVAGNVPGHEIEHPMAIVILGGLITSTLLNLIVVPPLYLRFGKSAKSVLNATNDQL